MESDKRTCGRCETCNVGVGTILSVAHNFQAPSLPVADSNEAGVVTVCLPVPVTVCVPIEYLDAHRKRSDVRAQPCSRRQRKDVTCGAAPSRPCLAKPCAPKPCPHASDTRCRRRQTSRMPSREPSCQLVAAAPPCLPYPPTPALPCPPCRYRTSQVCRTSEERPPPRKKKCESCVSTDSERPLWPQEPEGKRKPSISVDLSRLVPSDKRREESLGSVPKDKGRDDSRLITNDKRRDESRVITNDKRRDESRLVPYEKRRDDIPSTTGKKKRTSVSSTEPAIPGSGDKKRRESIGSNGKKKRDSFISEVPLDPKKRTSGQTKRKCERRPLKPTGTTTPDVPKSCKPRTKHPCIRRPIKKNKDGTGQLTSKGSTGRMLSPSQAEMAKREKDREASLEKKGKDDKDGKKNGGKKDGGKKGDKSGGKKNGTKKGEGGGKGGGKGDKRKGSGGKGKGKRKKKKSIDRDPVLLVRCPPAMFDTSMPMVSVPCQPFPPCCR